MSKYLFARIYITYMSFYCILSWAVLLFKIYIHQIHTYLRSTVQGKFDLKLFLIEIQVVRQTCMNQVERMVVKPSDPLIEADPRKVCRKIPQKTVRAPLR